MRLQFTRLISETVLVLRVLRSLSPRLSILWATTMAIGAGMILLGQALATGGSALRELGVFFLFMGSLQMLPLLYWAIKSLRTGRELLADPDTQITFRDDQVQLYRPEVKIREKIMVHNRLVESETTIRPYKYVSLPGWLLDDPERYGIKLPPPKTPEK
jgi:hypothetical protein